MLNRDRYERPVRNATSSRENIIKTAEYLAEIGHENFSGQLGGENNGSQNCAVTLSGGDGKEYIGQTGKGHGHAEMDALHVFIDSLCKKNDKDIESAVEDYISNYQHKMKLVCKDKPCCRGCATILGLLNIWAGNGTYKSKKRMGSTQWRTSELVKAFLKLYINNQLKYGDDKLSNLNDATIERAIDHLIDDILA